MHVYSLFFFISFLFRCHRALSRAPVLTGEGAQRASEGHPVVSSSLYSPWDSPGQNTGVGSLSPLQGVFPTQGLKPGLLHCGRILHQLSHKGSPRILEWVSLLQQMFPTQELNQDLLHCRRILYQLSYRGSPQRAKGNLKAPWWLHLQVLL